MSRPIEVAPLIALIVMTVFEFLAAVVIQFRLLPVLQADTIRIGRAGNAIPTDQFVSWAVPILICLGCLSIFGVYVVNLRRRQAP